jgi:hypothetical protein
MAQAQPIRIGPPTNFIRALKLRANVAGRAAAGRAALDEVAAAAASPSGSATASQSEVSEAEEVDAAGHIGSGRGSLRGGGGAGGGGRGGGRGRGSGRGHNALGVRIDGVVHFRGRDTSGARCPQ